MSNIYEFILVEFSSGPVHIVHMRDWATCIALGLGTTPVDLWLHEMPSEYRCRYMRDGVGVTMRSMSDFEEL